MFLRSIRLIFILVFVIFCYRLSLLQKAYNTKDWESCEARITSYRVEKARNPDSTSRHLYSYVPILEYTFSFNGVKYRGNYLRYSTGADFSEGRINLDSMASEYAVGSRLRVFVNPLNPLESVVIPGVSYSLYFLCSVFGFASIIAGVTSLALPSHLRNFKKRC